MKISYFPPFFFLLRVKIFENVFFNSKYIFFLFLQSTNLFPFLFYLFQLDDWVLCRIYKKNSGTQVSVSAKERNTLCSSPSSYLDDVALESFPEINDQFFSLPRVNSLKYLQNDKQTLQGLQGLGTAEWVGQRSEFGCNGQNQSQGAMAQFSFPEIPPLCQVESPSEMRGSSIEDEVESALFENGLTQHQHQHSTQWVDSFASLYPAHLAAVGFGCWQ